MPAETAKVHCDEMRITLDRRSESKLRLDYATHVHSIAFRVTGEIAVKIKAVIPTKTNRWFAAEFDQTNYKWRNLIENFFQKINEFRGIATRYCKTDTSYSAFISPAATVIRLKWTSTGPN